MAAGEYVKKQFKQLIPQFMQNHPTCFYQAFLMALSGAAEQLWEEVGFKCPSNLNWNSHKHYAIINFLGPAVSLWMICLLASNMAKMLCQGRGCHCIEERCCSTFWSVVFQTLVIPLAWVFVSLMDGDIYACFHHIPNCTIDSNTTFIDGIDCTRWYEANKTESKLYGWYFAGISLFVLFLGVTAGRCCGERRYFPNFYSNILKKRERVEMEKFLEDGAKATAAENAGAIAMAVKEVKSKDWKDICMLHQNKTNTDKEYYSPLSEWVAKNPHHLVKYQKSVAGNQVLAPTTAQAQNQKKNDTGNQVLTTNSDSAPATEGEAPP